MARRIDWFTSAGMLVSLWGFGCIEPPEPTEATKHAERVDCGEVSTAERVKVGGSGIISSRSK